MRITRFRISGEWCASVTIGLFNFVYRHVTDVSEGKIPGLKLAKNHVVRGQEAFGSWVGTALNLQVSTGQICSRVDPDRFAMFTESNGAA